MEINIVCSLWVKEDDEIVLNILRKSNTWLSAETLSEMTGIHIGRVKRTLSHIIREQKRYESRKKLKDFLED